MTRKICVVTGSRAEYGLLRLLMQGIRATPGVELQVIATGMHLSPDFGLTYREIEQDGLQIDRRVEMLLASDTATAVSKSTGLGISGCADALLELRPDLLVVLGDRFEIFAAATAAMIAGIPIAHIHGGETSQGAIDEAIRHCITKMAHLHFVAAPEYADRVIQLGEQPDRVFLVGGLGVDAIQQMPLLDRPALEQALDFRLGERNLLVTYHPVTLDPAQSQRSMVQLLAALAQLRDTHLIFTLPNADTGNRVLTQLVQEFVATHPHARAYASLGQERYFSCMKHVDAVVGNSSSGLLEAPTLRVATVNIGERQRGRLKADSVIDCEPECAAILSALQRVYSADFRRTLRELRNPYGEGGASRKIIDVLSTHSLDGILKKSFYDVARAAAPAR